MKISTNELFGPTIQGEGKSAGREVLFLRLARCSLACVWCDTPYTWNWTGTKFQHPEKFDPKKEIHELTEEEVVERLHQLSNTVKALVISGGEPLIQQQKLIGLLTVLKADGWWIEVETNGTIVPLDSFVELVDQFNCSPKLSNSGPDNRLKMRERPEALKKLASLSKTTFKFVIITDTDLEEVLGLVRRYNLQQVYLMPEGRTKEEQLERQEKVRLLCKNQGFKFSPRLHILKWGARRAI